MMNNYLFVLLSAFSLVFISCKENTPERPAKASQEQTNSSTRNGNTITQKVTVGADTKDTNIDVKTAMEMLAKDKSIKVLDVRTPGEIKDGSYPNSLKIDFNGDNFKTEINKLDKNDTYIVYCRSGGRSKKAVSMMKAFGISKAYNMKDGFKALDKASKQ